MCTVRVRRGALAAAMGAGLLAVGPSVAEDRSQPVNFSLFHPASTSPDPDVRTNFRLSLLYGHVREVRGVDLGGLVARTSGDSRGLRFTILASVVAGEARGLSATAGVDYVAGDVSGLQLAGLVAYDRGNFTGLQFAGLFGFVGQRATGFQLSSVFNLAEGAGRLFQISGVANAVGGDLEGLQISGLNFVEAGMTGVQVGGFNFAERLRGIQIGGFNSALSAGGPQIGLVNLSDEHESVPIGLASFANDSNTDWIVEGSSLVGIATGIRTSVHGWRASAVVGASNATDETAEVGAFAWWWGREFALGSSGSWLLAPDLGMVHLVARDAEPGEDERRPAGQVRLLLEYRVGPRFAVYAGGGISLEYTKYGDGAESEVEGLGLLGVSLF